MLSSVEPSVHYLDFKDGRPAYDRFHVLWKLVDLDKQPTVLGDNVDGSKQNDFRLAEGDLVVFQSLLSGAGEFEGVRFVGAKMAEDDDALPLLPAGIEYPEFPSLIVQHIDNVASLKTIYEAPFNAVLQEQSSKYNLRDVFSSDEDAYNQFWNDPPIARRRGPPGGDPWLISLSDCIWIKTLDGKSLRGDKDLGVAQEEL